MVFHQVRDELLFPKMIVHSYRRIYHHQREKQLVAPEHSIYIHQPSFSDRMAQIEQSMLGKLPSLSPPGFKGLQRTDPVVQCCSEGTRKRTERSRIWLWVKCRAYIEESEWDQMCRWKAAEEKEDTSWWVKEPCSEQHSGVGTPLRPEKSKTWVSFN